MSRHLVIRRSIEPRVAKEFSFVKKSTQPYSLGLFFTTKPPMNRRMRANPPTSEGQGERLNPATRYPTKQMPATKLA